MRPLEAGLETGDGWRLFKAALLRSRPRWLQLELWPAELPPTLCAVDLEETLSALRGFVGVQVSVSTVPLSLDGRPMPPRTWSELFGVLSLGQEALDPIWGDILTPDWCEAFGLETHEGGTIIVMRAVDTGDEIGVYDVTPRSFRNSEWVEIEKRRSLVINLGHHTVTVSPYEEP